MSQYLIREFTDSTGYIHKHISKTRDNEHLFIINAESKQDALSKYNNYKKEKHET